MSVLSANAVPSYL